MAATSGAVKALWANSKAVLSEEDIDGVVDDAATQFSFPITVTADSISDDTDAESQLEKTGRIPVIGADGQIIQPGEESQRALEAERAAIDAAYAAGNAPVPPSFAPKNPPTEDDSSDVADATLFGKVKTKVVAIIIAVIVVAVALGFAIHGLTKNTSTGTSAGTSASAWPEMNLDDVPFGTETTQPSDDSSSAADADASPSVTKKATKQAEDKVITTDKKAKKVPDPKQPENNTPYEIDNRQFVSNPDGQQGYGYYVHLSQPHDVYRLVIKIRSSGGQGYVRVNTTSNPTQGEQVAQFEFDASGTTDVKFDRTVNTQDILLWVPLDSLPGNQLYIDSFQVF